MTTPARKPAHDWLDSDARLVEWSRLAKLLPDRALRALATRAKQRPRAAVFALARA